MSRLTGADAYGLMEAYQAVYAPQELTEEQVWEEVETWVNSLLEEGYDLSDYTWEEMYEAYIEEIYGTNLGGNIKTKPNKLDTAVGNAIKSITSSGADATPRTTGIYGQPTRKPAAASDGKVGPKIVGPKIVGPKIVGPKLPVADGDTSTTPTTSVKPAAPTGGKGKVAPTKPAATAQTGDKTKDMATFAKANPTLAASAAERARTRGTSQYDNPLMRGMPGKRPMTPSVQSPTLAKDLGKGSGNQSLLNNPNASKAATPPPAAKVTPAATSSVGQKASGLSLGSSQFKATAIAASPKPTPVAPTKAPILQKQDFDVFDVIKGHLLDEGYADTEESALAIMANMSEEWRESIVEGLVDAVASGAGTVVGTAQRAAREIPKYVQQKVNNVAGTYEYARQRADANAPSGKMTTNPRSSEFSHGNQGGKPAPMKPMKTMRNPGPNFGRG